MQNKEIPIEIRHGDIETVVKLSQTLVEFDNPHQAAEYHKRLDNVKHLILVAYKGERAVGFKVGYDKGDTFYSWMGGVHADYRRRGIAQQLADAQEAWAIEQGYDNITFKTRNDHKAMLLFAIGNGFQISEVIPRERIEAYRIVLKKRLIK